MANKSLNSQIITKNDTATNWANSSLVLGKGELALDTDNNICKIGDGIHTWAFLSIINRYTHPTSGVSAGTYRSVVVNAAGHVTSGTNPTTLAGYGITDAYKIPIIGAVGYFAGSSFSEDATYTDYPYSYKWDVTGSFDLSTMVPQIVFDHACAVSGLFSPVCKLEATGVRIYAKSIPTFSVIVSSCIIWKGLYTKDTSGLGFTNAIGYNNPTITAGTKCKITYSAKGYVTSGEDLSASDIPGLAWSKITSGTPTTLSGYGITDAASSSHVGATGAAHGVATTSVNGFMSSDDKTKLDKWGELGGNPTYNGVPIGGGTVVQFVRW